MKIIKGDKVSVISGKDKGRQGEVERVYSKSEKAVVKGINLYKKHMKKSEANPKGGIVEIPRPIYLSKLMVICPSCKEKTKIGFQSDAKGKKHRLCRKCKKVIN
jgi:large subunit ribosomal protein L24